MDVDWGEASWGDLRKSRCLRRTGLSQKTCWWWQGILTVSSSQYVPLHSALEPESPRLMHAFPIRFLTCPAGRGVLPKSIRLELGAVLTLIGAHTTTQYRVHQTMLYAIQCVIRRLLRFDFKSSSLPSNLNTPTPSCLIYPAEERFLPWSRVCHYVIHGLSNGTHAVFSG